MSITNLDVNFAVKDFAQEPNLFDNKEEAQGVLNKPGRISIDDDGHIAVINPNTKRDRGIVRFFKGVLMANKTYMNEQHMLDRYEQLKNNASFAKAISKEILGHCVQDKHGITKDEIASTVLKKLELEPNKGKLLDSAFIKEAIKATTGSFKSLTDRVSDTVRKCNEHSTANSKIFIDGKCLNAYELARDYTPHDANKVLPDDSRLSCSVMNLLAYGKCEFVDSIATKAEVADLRELLSHGNVYKDGVDPEIKERFDVLSKNLYEKFLGKLTDIANTFIQEGRDVGQIASAINDMFSAVVSSRDSSELMDRIFNQEGTGAEGEVGIMHALNKSAKVEHQDKISDAQKAKLDAIHEKFPDLDEKQQIKLANFLDKKGITLQTYADLLNDFASVAKPLVRASLTSLSSPFTFVDSIAQAISQKEGGVTADVARTIGEVFGFHQALVDEVRSDSVLSDLDLVRTCASESFAKLSEQFADNPQLEESAKLCFRTVPSIMDAFIEAQAEASGSEFRRTVANRSQEGFNAMVNQVSDILSSRTGTLAPLVQEKVNTFDESIRPAIAKLLPALLEAKLQELKGINAKDALDKLTESLHSNSDLCDALVQRTLSDEQQQRLEAYMHEGLKRAVGLEIKTLAEENAKDRERLGEKFVDKIFTSTFFKDANRAQVKTIGDENFVMYEPERVQEVLSKYVPSEFLNAVACLSHQGGMPYLVTNAVANNVIGDVIPFSTQSKWMIGRDGMPSFETMALVYQPINNGVTITKSDENHLQIQYSTNQDLMLKADKATTVLPIRYVVTATIDLSKGVDTNGYPNEISINLTREYEE